MSTSADAWFYANDGNQSGPVSLDDLRALVKAGRLRGHDLVWKEGWAEWVPASSVQGLMPVMASVPPEAPPPPVYRSGSEDAVKNFAGKKIAAGICGILIGTLGIHKFILGFNTAGVIMLLVSLLTCGVGAVVMWVIGIIEGIIYLTKSDQEFYQLYAIQKKEWF